MPCSAEALGNAEKSQFLSKRFAGVLTAAIAVQNYTLQELAILGLELTNCINIKLFLHVVSHFQCENFSGKAIQNRRNVQFSINALDFRNVLNIAK